MNPDTRKDQKQIQQEKRWFVAVISGGIFFWPLSFGIGVMVVAALMTGLLWTVGGGELVDAFWQGNPPYQNLAARILNEIWVILILSGGVLGMLYGYRFWKRIFINSGYLDEETVNRMVKNMAPTERIERIRKAIGFTFFLPATAWLVWVALTKGEKLWWLFVVPLCFLIYLLYLAWKEYFQPHPPDKNSP